MKLNDNYLKTSLFVGVLIVFVFLHLTGVIIFVSASPMAGVIFRRMRWLRAVHGKGGCFKRVESSSTFKTARPKTRYFGLILRSLMARLSEPTISVVGLQWRPLQSWSLKS